MMGWFEDAWNSLTGTDLRSVERDLAASDSQKGMFPGSVWVAAYVRHTDQQSPAIQEAIVRAMKGKGYGVAQVRLTLGRDYIALKLYRENASTNYDLARADLESVASTYDLGSLVSGASSEIGSQVVQPTIDKIKPSGWPWYVYAGIGVAALIALAPYARLIPRRAAA